MRSLFKLGEGPSVIRTARIKQVATLYGSLVASIGVGIAVTVFNTRVLGPHSYGNMKFLQTLFAIFTIVLTPGFFVTGSRLLAQRAHRGSESRLIGSLLVLAGILSVVLILALDLFSFVEGAIFDNQLGHVIRVCSPFLLALPLQLCIDNVLQGTNKIYSLSLFRFAPQALYLAVALIVNLWLPLTVLSAVIIQLATLIVIAGVTVITLKPDFSSPFQLFSLIHVENRVYGFQVYIGFLTGVASSHLGVLSIGYFVSSPEVGFFSLAIALTLPLTLIPNAVGTTYFRDFSEMSGIPGIVTRMTVVTSLVALGVFLLVIKEVVIALYSSEFLQTASLASMVAVGAVFHGFGDFYNRFVGAHGGGKQIRNSNLVVGSVNIVGNIVFVIIFGAVGAAITRILSGLAHLLMMFYAYKSMQRLGE